MEDERSERGTSERDYFYLCVCWRGRNEPLVVMVVFSTVNVLFDNEDVVESC
jgi:hypothetical protein